VEITDYKNFSSRTSLITGAVFLTGASIPPGGNGDYCVKFPAFSNHKSPNNPHYIMFANIYLQPV